MSTAETLVACHNELGEGIIWNEQEQAIYWVDILAPKIYRYDWQTQQLEDFDTPSLVGSFAFRTAGGMVVALQSGFHFFDPQTGEWESITDPESHLPDNRFNDGKCDRQGRFFSGTMHMTNRTPLGALYRLGADLQVKKIIADVIVPNSLCWSPDGKIMYFADTRKEQILCFPYDTDTGMPGESKILVDTFNNTGSPDGSTIDSEGYLWNAEFRGSRVVRYTPDGEVDRVVELPASQITCCAFVGPNLDHLAITSAKTGLDAKQETEAGNVFIADVGIKGLIEPRFAG